MVTFDAQAVFDSLPQHIAVVAHDGTIQSVNRAWTLFAKANGGEDESSVGVGANYFHACEQAQGNFSAEAPIVLAGLRRVLAGEISLFEIEYPCPAPNQARFFVLRATPLVGHPHSALVISHTDVTVRHHSRIERADAAQSAHRAAELQSLARLSESSPVSVTAQSFGFGSLSVNTPSQFGTLVEHYATLIQRALEERMYRVDNHVAEDLRDLANELGFLNAGPRDVVQIHTHTLKSAMPTHSPHAELFADEARLRALELMGYLVAFYRQRSSTLSIPTRLRP